MSMREFKDIMKEFTNLYEESDYGHFPLRIKLSAREEKIGIGAGNIRLVNARYTGPPAREGIFLDVIHLTFYLDYFKII